LLGVPSNIYLEHVVDREVTEDEYEDLLAEVRAAMGEVGRLNPTLGKSLSWNAEHTLDGLVTGTHLMVKPGGGQTRIRLTEGGGRPAAVGALVLAAAAGTGLGAGLATVEGLPLLLEPFMAVGLVGFTVVARVIIGRVMAWRYRKLNTLLDRLAALVAEPESTHADRVLPK